MLRRRLSHWYRHLALRTSFRFQISAESCYSQHPFLDPRGGGLEIMGRVWIRKFGQKSHAETIRSRVNSPPRTPIKQLNPELIPLQGPQETIKSRVNAPQRDPNPQKTIKSRVNSLDRGAEQNRQLTLELSVSFLYPDKTIKCRVYCLDRALTNPRSQNN